MKKAEYITPHAFYWRRAKNKFVKSILDAGGDILSEAKARGYYLARVSNPNHSMRGDIKWAKSNNKFWFGGFSLSLFTKNKNNTTHESII